MYLASQYQFNPADPFNDLVEKIEKRKQFCESAFVIQLSCIAENDNILGPSIIGLVGCQMVDAASFVLNEGLQKQGGSETLLEPHLAEIRNYVPSYILSGFAYKTLMEDPKSFWLYLKIPWKKMSSVQNGQPYNPFERRDFQIEGILYLLIKIEGQVFNKCPKGKCSKGKYPRASVPRGSVPRANVPRVNIPRENVPRENMQGHVSQGHVPRVSVQGQMSQG